MNNLAVEQLTIRRFYKHRREKVFAAFCSAAAMQRWFSPSANVTADIQRYDFEPGGRYQIEYLMPDGDRLALAGEFLQIDKPNALSFTWAWQPPDIHAGIETRVHIDFIDDAGHTELLLAHEQLNPGTMQDRHQQGWLTTLQRLEVVLA